MISSVESIKARLTHNFDTISVRGSQRAVFLFIEHCGSAIELSADNGKWWIEFWDCSSDDDAPPTKELTVDSDEMAIAAIEEWLILSN